MNNVRRAALLLLVFTVLCVSGGKLVLSAIDRPLAGPATGYTADFDNVAGLQVGNDVRAAGVRVGKVTGIGIHRDEDLSIARIEFDVDDPTALRQDTRLAIRYLNLTGVRYVDLQQSQDGPTEPSSSRHIPLDRTTPSFDITQVFNGLAPVFATLSPEDVNRFSESMLAVVQGDGSGMGEMLRSLTTVLEFADDRAAVIDRLVNNLSEISKVVDGRSEYLSPIIEYIARFGTVVSRVGPGLRSLADSSGVAAVEVNRLLTAAGFRKGREPILYELLDPVLPLAHSMLDVLTALPGLRTALDQALTPPVAPTQADCSKGRAELPPTLAIFIKGKELTLCRR